jgi:hypothetical protein
MTNDESKEPGNSNDGRGRHRPLVDMRKEQEDEDGKMKGNEKSRR